jgi:tetratricopeptide (TPR) repeat protein
MAGWARAWKEARPSAEQRPETAIRPPAVGDDADDWNAHGIAFRHESRFGEALAAFDRALALAPDYPPALYNKGLVLAGLDRLDEAVDCFRLALENCAATEPPTRVAEVCESLAGALCGLNRYEEAVAVYRALATLKADPTPVEWYLSMALLMLGRFAEGWQKYESRFAMPENAERAAEVRPLDLSEVAGKRVLVWGEQGHGDNIQFARYVPLLAARGAQVCFAAYPELAPLMREMEGVGSVMTSGDAKPECDLVTSLLSLPLAFRTELASIPGKVPYLRAPAARLSEWRAILGPRRQPRVGIAWWGSQHIPYRSLPLAALEPLLQRRDVTFHVLHTEIPVGDRLLLAKYPHVVDHSAALGDFADTAALIQSLDLVVTIDTSVAHLAGALARPVWIMLAFSADWRWLLDRDDSPWYPTARLFRQKRRGDWESVMTAVSQALSEWFAGERGSGAAAALHSGEMAGAPA